jgi:hypothetical protein
LEDKVFNLTLFQQILVGVMFGIVFVLILRYACGDTFGLSWKKKAIRVVVAYLVSTVIFLLLARFFFDWLTIPPITAFLSFLVTLIVYLLL